ncbi:hypothetical protein ABBQ38_000353 [Trebouxia sp. C0009 RCD-2024]
MDVYALTLRDASATLLSGVLAFGLVKSLETLAAQKALTTLECRKIVHMSTGPLFVLTWPLFSAGLIARWCAASVPFFNGVRLILIASGAMQSEATLKAVSRFGSRQELLRGPLLYIAIVISVTLLFWRESPIGLLVLCLMCGGDGLADIVGRRYGSAKLPFNHSKSWVGSLAMFTGGGLLSMTYIALFHKLGYFAASAYSMMPVIWTTSLLATIVEALPIHQRLDDNLTVPLVSAAVGQLFMQGLHIA